MSSSFADRICVALADRLEALQAAEAPLQRVAIISGGNSGLGYESARRLMLAGSSVLIACRSQQRAAEAVAKLKDETGADSVQAMVLDVSSLQAVRDFVRAFKGTGLGISVLMCNAGIMMGPRRESADGHELQFATNFLGHVLLCELLMDQMLLSAKVSSEPTRIVHVSSVAGMFCRRINVEDLMFTTEYDSLAVYQQSKCAQMIYSKNLAQRLANVPQIVSNSIEPGIVATNLSSTITDSPEMAQRIASGVSVEQGASTQVHCALDPSMATVSGLHLKDSRAVALPPSHPSYDPGGCTALLDQTAALLGLPAFAPVASA